MRKRILVVLVGVVMALTTAAAPVYANHSGSYHGSYYKDGPFCHWYGHGYKVVWGKSHYYHGDYRAKKYYGHYSCRYLYDDHRGFGYDPRYDDGYGYGYGY